MDSVDAMLCGPEAGAFLAGVLAKAAAMAAGGASGVDLRDGTDLHGRMVQSMMYHTQQAVRRKSARSGTRRQI